MSSNLSPALRSRDRLRETNPSSTHNPFPVFSCCILTIVLHRILDLKENQITSLSGLKFDFLKCNDGEFDSCSTPTALQNRIAGEQLPQLNMATNKITSLAGASFAGSIKCVSLPNISSGCWSCLQSIDLKILFMPSRLLRLVDNPTLTSLAGASFSGSIG